MLWARSDWRPVFVVSAIVLVFCGCGETPQIQHYQAPKDPLPVSRPGPSVVANEPVRLLAAVVRHDDAVWFFKMSASPEVAEQHEPGLRQIVQSLTFDAEGNPRWTLPDGWSERAGDAIRYRTLISAGALGRSAEVSVTRLPATGGDWDAYLLANVNRWRNQIGLPALSALELTSVLHTLKTASGEDVYWCDFQSGEQGSAQTTGSPPAGTGAAGELQLGGVPGHWTSLPADALRQAAFAIVSGNARAEVTLIALGPQSGSLLDNVNRWRGQIGLAPWSESQMEQARQRLPLQGGVADYFELMPEAPGGEAILGAIVRRPDRVWFFKFRGPDSLANQEKENFRRFVQETRLP